MHRKVIYTALAWAPMVAAVVGPEPGDATLAFASDSGQIINRTIVYEDAPSYAPCTPQANDQVAWHTPLTTPTRRLVSINDFRATFPIQPQARDQVWWYQPLTTPVRFARSTYAQQTFVYSYYPLEVAAAPGDANLAFASTSSQVINRTIVYESEAYAPYTPPAVVEEITIDKYWRQLDLPVRRKQVTAEEGSIFGAPLRAEANDQVAWHKPLEAPTRAKRLPAGAIPFEARYAFPMPPWGWYAKLDEPFRLKKTPATQLSLTFVAAAPGAGAEYNWFIPIDWPTRARKLYEFPATAIPVYFVPPSPGAGNEFNWWPQLDEPIRPRKSIRTAEQKALTTPPRLLTTDLEYSWHQRLNEPVRLKLTFGKYPGSTIQGNIDPVVPLAWSWVDDPRRRKFVLHDHRAIPGQYVAEAELITIDKWWAELGRQHRVRAPLNRSDFARGNINPVVPLAWSWVDDPRRLRPRFNVSAFAQGNINPIVPFGRSWVDDPRRRLKRVDRPALSQGNVFPGAVEVGKFTQWWRQLDLPVREWRKIAWQWSVTVPPTGVSFFVEGGPADESERVICVPVDPRLATVPDVLRLATVPLQDRVATVPELLRVAEVPEQSRTVNSNEYRDRPC